MLLYMQHKYRSFSITQQIINEIVLTVTKHAVATNLALSTKLSKTPKTAFHFVIEHTIILEKSVSMLSQRRIH